MASPRIHHRLDVAENATAGPAQECLPYIVRGQDPQGGGQAEQVSGEPVRVGAADVD